MTDIKAPLIHDLVLWCDRSPRSYAEVLEAWRTSCPRLTVWEDAVDRGLLETRTGGAGGSGGLTVAVTDKGLALLAQTPAKALQSPSGPAAAICRSAA